MGKFFKWAKDNNIFVHSSIEMAWDPKKQHLLYSSSDLKMDTQIIRVPLDSLAVIPITLGFRIDFKIEILHVKPLKTF